MRLGIRELVSRGFFHFNFIDRVLCPFNQVAFAYLIDGFDSVLVEFDLQLLNGCFNLGHRYVLVLSQL